MVSSMPQEHDSVHGDARVSCRLSGGRSDMISRTPLLKIIVFAACRWPASLLPSSGWRWERWWQWENAPGAVDVTDSRRWLS